MLNRIKQDCADLDQRPKSVDFANIVHQSEQHPLYIHFSFRAQREAMHPLLHTDVGKHRFHDPQPPGINALALFTIDLGLHFIDQVRRLPSHWYGKIPARCGGFAQAACLHGTSGTVFHASMVNIIGAIAVDLVACMTGQFLSLRTTIHLFVRIEREVSCREEPWLGVGSLPAVNAILETLLIGKARIACAVLDVGNVGIDLFSLADLQAVERMIVGIGGQLFALKIAFIFSDGDGVFFAPSTIGLRFS